MRCVIKRRREAGDHRSSTPRTETHTSLSVLSRGRRNPRVVVLPSFASLDYAVRFHGFPPFRFRLLALLRSPRSFGWRIPKSPVRAAARRLHLSLRGSLPRLCISPRHTPMFRQIRKRGTVSRPPQGVNSYSSSPATTVSSVDDSNAFAASVTGR